MAIGHAVAGLPCLVLIITIPFGIGCLAPAPSHLAAESHLAGDMRGAPGSFSAQNTGTRASHGWSAAL